jgi:leader peptidase (prepilin peptidase)/N-methyltransferase
LLSAITSLLQAFPALYLTVAVLLGLAVGSFLNVVIHRLPRMLERQWRAECAEFAGDGPAPGGGESSYNLVVPRSACPACGHGITALENIPLLSYAVLRGRCSSCGVRISPRYPLVEALCAGVTAYAAWHFGLGAAVMGAALFSWAMIALAFIDLDTFYLPDTITLPLLWAGLMFNIFGVFTSLESAVIGAVAGYLALWSVYWAYRLATGKEGMGYGDFKLLAAIGAWLGWKMLPLVILLASCAGALIGVGLIVFARRAREAPIPFGPYLAIGGLVALFHGKGIARQYLGIF